MEKKECPSCAMKIDADAKACPICEYEFPVNTKYQWIVAVMIVVVILFVLYRLL
jgi:RNA polymerase subunit RPABC4/transcription elongation factor Spt4